MKKSLLRLLIVLIAVSMIATFSLVGCKTTTTEITAAPTTAASETTVAPDTTAAAEPVNLVFWDFGNYGVAALQEGSPKEEWYIYKAVARFEAKNPGITIEITYQPGDKSTEMLTAAAMSKQGPDVVSLWGGTYVTSIKDSLLVLNDYFTPEEIAAVNGWKNVGAVDGKYYGAPIITSSTMIFYNKSIFEDAGIDPVKDYDGTYDGLLALCEKFKDAGITPLIAGASDGWGNSFIEGSIFASQFASGDAEKTMTEIMAGEKNFATTPEMVAAFQADQDLYTKGYYNDDAPTIAQGEACTLFLSGGGAMMPNGDGTLAAFRKALGDNLGILPMPSLKADSPGFGVTIGALGTNAIAATNYGKHPIESTNFIRFMRTYEEEKEFVKATGGLPSVKGDYTGIGDPLVKDINVTNIALYLDNQMPPQVSDTWWKLESQMLSGQMSVLEFLEAMDSARDEALAASK